MLYIEKTSPSQQICDKIAEIKNTPGWRNAENSETIRSFFDLQDKGVLRRAILPEQHGLCAYCMRRIYDDGKAMTVEHFIPLSKSKEEALRYRNYLGVCDGGQKAVEEKRAPKETLCCDRAKADEEELLLDPKNRQLMAGIAYRNDGAEIYFTHENAAIVEEANRELSRVLMLNGLFRADGTFKYDTATQVVKGRKDAYRMYDLFVRKAAKNGILTSATVQGEIERILALPQYPEYAGVQLFYLMRKYRTLKAQGK